MSLLSLASLHSKRLFLSTQEASMRAASAILGLAACVSAFQYPQGSSYGRQNVAYEDNLLGNVYGRFQGPYSTQFYQKKYGGQAVSDRGYQKGSIYDQLTDSEQYSPIDDMQSKNGNQGLYNVYKGLYNKYSSGIYNKYLNKFYDYFNNNNNYNKREFSTDVNGQDVKGPVKNMDSNMVKKQQDVYQLLRFIQNPVYDDAFQKVYSSFSFEKYADNYKTEAYERFMRLWKNKAYLPKGSIFSVMNEQHVKQVQALFDLFHTAKNYETFYKTAVWARQHINEGMFLYTYSVALVHRKDTQGLALPAIYELYPQYFFSSKVIKKALDYKMSHYQGTHTLTSGIYTIRSDSNVNPEQDLSYFTEDVGVNAFYYYYNLYFPYWMNSKKYQLDEKRGELFYYVHHQLLARFYLERLSHGVGGLDFFNWDAPFRTGYNPALTYPNGEAFNERPESANLQEYFNNYGQRWCNVGKYGYGYTYVSTYEQRIREAIDLGIAYTQDGKKVDLYTPEGLNILANLIEGNADSPNMRYYGSYMNFARHLLGYAKQPSDNFSLTPSALEHFETSLRDPAFFQLSKKILLLFQKFKVNMPEYTEKDLLFPGVKVEKFETDPLETFYEKFYTDVTNCLTITPEEGKYDSTFKIQVEQYRLNHKNFSYKVYVNSDKDTKANVRVFIGPKLDELGRTIDFSENRNNFVELDQFIYNLKSGENVIVRESKDFLWFGGDKTSYLELYENVKNTEDFEKVYKVDDFMNGFPRRYMIPRGSADGTSYQLYVILSPYKPQQSETTQTYYETKYNQETVFTAKQNDDQVYDKMDQYKMVRIDSYPLGYPFDRPAEFQQTYLVPNARMVDVKIYHQVLKTEAVETEFYFEAKPIFFM